MFEHNKMYEYDDLSFESNTTNATSQFHTPEKQSHSEESEQSKKQRREQRGRLGEAEHVDTLPRIFDISIKNW